MITVHGFFRGISGSVTRAAARSCTTTKSVHTIGTGDDCQPHDIRPLPWRMAAGYLFGEDYTVSVGLMQGAAIVRGFIGALEK